jgi:predicted enzyme related to lactoylglutathione lyase/uncharacterized protein YndB with AHSA1/START domain
MKNVLILVLVFILSNHLTGQTTMKLSDKQIKITRITSQPIDSVWWKWTTHEGLRTFLGYDNKIEFAPGGAFEIYFLKDNPEGLKGSEGCKVLSYLPGKYFSFSWNAPPQFKQIRESEYHTWVVVGLNTLPDNRTEITLTHLGWPADEKWTPVFDYFSTAWENVMNQLVKNEKSNTDIQPQIKKVTGLGGIFFKCKDPDKLKAWYTKHLGIETDQYGTIFGWRQIDDASKKGYTVWSPFSETTKYFEPSVKDFMINYRVENIEALIDDLKKEGVTVIDKIETYDYGKFVHILDIEGNSIELWEPVDVEFEKIVKPKEN